MNATKKDPAAELLGLAGGYLVSLKTIVTLTDMHHPQAQSLSANERLEAIAELACAALEHREPQLKAAALACIQSNPLLDIFPAQEREKANKRKSAR